MIKKSITFALSFCLSLQGMTTVYVTYPELTTNRILFCPLQELDTPKDDLSLIERVKSNIIKQNIPISLLLTTDNEKTATLCNHLSRFPQVQIERIQLNNDDETTKTVLTKFIVEQSSPLQKTLTAFYNNTIQKTKHENTPHMKESLILLTIIKTIIEQKRSKIIAVILNKDRITPLTNLLLEIEMEQEIERQTLANKCIIS